MGWTESPPFFCVASETCRDVAAQYAKTPVGSLLMHKFTRYTTTGKDYKNPPLTKKGNGLGYMLELYVDDYIALAVPTSQDQLNHVSNAILKGMHDVFPKDDEDSEDPISPKKHLKASETWFSLL